MLKNLFHFIFFLSCTTNLAAQQNDSIVYNFDRIIKYNEYRKHDKKTTFKRYFFVSSEKTDVHLVAFEKNGELTYSLKGEAPKVSLSRAISGLQHPQEILIEVDGDIENYNDPFSFKIEKKDVRKKVKTKTLLRNDSIVQSQSRIRVYVSYFQNKNQLAVKEEIHIDYSKSQIPLRTFTWYDKEIGEDTNSLTNGLMTFFKTRYDGDVKDGIELKLVSIKKQNLKLILRKVE